MPDSEEVRRLVREDHFVLSDHAIKRMHERRDHGVPGDMPSLRAAVRRFMECASTRRRRGHGGAIHMARNGVVMVVGTHVDQKWGPRAVVITIYRQGGGTMPRSAFV